VALSKFTCNACNKRTSFALRRSQPQSEAKMPGPGPYREVVTRIYACDNCKAANEMTQPTAFWEIIDGIEY